MNRIHRLGTLLLALLITVVPAIGQSQGRPADLVDPLVGTANEGQTFPSAGVPFAMTQWTPATRNGQKKGLVPYYFADSIFRGFRGSHFLSGSATQDYGSMQLVMGEGEPRFSNGVPAYSFTHAREHATPYLYRVALPGPGLEVSMTGTARCGMFRVKFLRGGKAWILMENFAQPGDGSITIDKDRQEMISQSSVRRIYAGSGKPAGFSGYAVAQFDHRFEVGGSWPGTTKQPGNKIQNSDQGWPGGYVFFNLKPGEIVHVRIGTSFTGLDEARRNLRAEIPGWDFEEVAQQAAAKWNRELGKIQISGSLQDRRVFYTALYHAMLLPRIVNDVDGKHVKFGGGGVVKTANGHAYYDDYSIWDTFRAVHPLFTILDPRMESEMVQSLIDKGEEGGFLPIFPAWNSYTAEMTGDHGVAIIGDAWLKGLRGFDIEKAYALMRRNAFESPATREDYLDGKGLRALSSYLKYGYIPLEEHVREGPHPDQQVSRTLDYAYDDYVLSQVARSLGKSKDADSLAMRAQNYRKVIDPESGFARGRYADGSWISPSDPTQRVSYITEGLPFQFTFLVLQDIPGLIQLEHGNEGFVAKLDELFQKGLYEQGNEPSHHIAYLYDYAGAAWKTQQHIHDVVTTLYKDSPDGLPGNDDAGQMSAWFVFSALGFYPVTPGIPAYAIGTPHFERAAILLPSGRQFEIVAHNLSPQNFYIQSVTLNGQPLNRFWLRHSEIVHGGRLEFQMSAQPNASWPASATVPEGLAR